MLIQWLTGNGFKIVHPPSVKRDRATSIAQNPILKGSLSNFTDRKVDSQAHHLIQTQRSRYPTFRRTSSEPKQSLDVEDMILHTSATDYRLLEDLRDQ
jgi:hypothetical protein